MKEGEKYGWCLNDGNSLNNLLLVHLGAGSIKVAHDGGHAGLVAHGRGQVDWFLWVIFGKAVSNVSASTLEWSHDF